ncbi:MAG: TetR/AcrR family transcriptional regulator [Spirochaetaceae bacterium]
MDKRKEKEILIMEKARELFLDKGLFNVVMDDIANQVGLTRRTLYRYFDTKESLAYETTIFLLNDWNVYHKEVFDKLTGSGLIQFESFLFQLIDYMSNKTNVMKYLGEFDFYFKDEKINKPSTDSMERFNNIILESDELLTQLLVKGIKDKTIKEDIDIKLMVSTISNVLWSFGQRIAIRNEMILSETGISGIELIKNQVSIYILALKAD